MKRVKQSCSIAALDDSTQVELTVNSEKVLDDVIVVLE